jgi:hypothetical protein
MNVKVKSQESVAQKGARYVLVATKDLTAGETIYTVKSPPKPHVLNPFH